MHAIFSQNYSDISICSDTPSYIAFKLYTTTTTTTYYLLITNYYYYYYYCYCYY